MFVFVCLPLGARMCFEANCAGIGWFVLQRGWVGRRKRKKRRRVRQRQIHEGEEGDEEKEEEEEEEKEGRAHIGRRAFRLKRPTADVASGGCVPLPWRTRAAELNVARWASDRLPLWYTSRSGGIVA